MIRPAFWLAGLALAACNADAPTEGNSVAANAVVEQSADQCAPPQLAMAGGAPALRSALFDEAKANFKAAYVAACKKGLLADRPLVDPEATDQGHIFIVNAPDANDASFYFSEVDGNAMILEYPFLASDGISNVPSAEELEEAIYCRVHGATPEEQESSGRCLVD